MPTKKHCFTCGRLTEVTSKHVCKNPDPNFETRLVGMTEDEIKKALRNENFREQHARLQCQRRRERNSTESEIAALKQEKENPPTPRQISEDIGRYGRTDQVTTAEGEKEIKISEVADTPAEDTDKATVIAKNKQEIERPKRMGNLKSQSFPVVPVIRRVGGKEVLDPIAPFGYDKNYRPIRRPETPAEREQRIALTPLPPEAQASPESASELCEHKRPKGHCFYCGTVHVPPKDDCLYCRNDAQVHIGSLDQENILAARRKVRRGAPTPAPVNKPSFVLLTKVFGISSLGVVALLDKVAEELDVEDKTPDQIINQETRRVLIEPIKEREMAEELKTHIKNLEEWRAAHHPKDFTKKRLREEGDTRNLVDDPIARRRLSREQKKEIEWHDKRIRELQGALRKVQKVLREWETDEKHWRVEKVPGTGTIIPGEIRKRVQQITFRQLITEGHCRWLDQPVDSGKLGGYESEVQEGSHPEGFGGFENFLIRAAIRAGVFTPDNLAEALKKHPWITWKDQAQAIETTSEDEERDDSGEVALIKKTGGASIGGRVIGAGRTASGRQRPLNSFDKGGKLTGGEDQGGGADQSGNWSSDSESDDYSEDSEA
jgi:uncharacterized OB-fold protein